MKKTIALLMALILTLAMCACGSKDSASADGGTDAAGDAAASDIFADIDMNSTEEQTVNEERATKDVLSEAFKTYLGGLNYFTGTDMEKLTYSDLKEHIGMDCSSYVFEDSIGSGVYIWKADGDDACYLGITFDDNGNLKYASALNLG